jgi:hypothetical protein
MQIVNPDHFAGQSLLLENEKTVMLQMQEQKRVLQSMINDKCKIH